MRNSQSLSFTFLSIILYIIDWDFIITTIKHVFAEIGIQIKHTSPWPTLKCFISRCVHKSFKGSYTYSLHNIVIYTTYGEKLESDFLVYFARAECDGCKHTRKGNFQPSCVLYFTQRSIGVHRRGENRYFLP